MAAKIKMGNDIYDLLISLILTLSPKQAGRLYSELLPRYSRKAKVRLYNADGEIDPDNGKIRLMESQYKAIRTKFGDSYVKKAFKELTSYIEFLEQHQDETAYKQKLRDYNSKSHNLLLSEGWVYEKCKGYIVKERPKLSINPFMIEDYNTAKEYVLSINKSLWDSAMDIKMLFLKFPTLKDEVLIKEQTNEK